MLKPVRKGPFLGVNNRLDRSGLFVKDVGWFVADAVNVELTNSKTFRLRDIETRLESMSGAHSLFKASNGHIFLVRDSVLYRITLPAYSETLLKLLTSDAPVSYVEYAGSVYYSNGTDSGRIDSGVWYPMALPTPSAPTVSAISGNLDKGQYRVAVAYINSTTGEEGGLSAAGAIDLADGSGIHVVLPGVISGASHVAVYLSHANGSVLMLKTLVDASQTSINLVTPADGREGVQRFEAPLPAGELFMFNGCLCSFNGGDVYEGIPYRPGYYLPVEGRIPFPADVSNVIPAQNGVYVVADITRWFSGSRMTQATSVIDVLPYGGVQGTAFEFEFESNGVTTPCYGWFGLRGIVLASSDGTVRAPMAANVVPVLPERGAATVIETRGIRRVVACGWCLNLENFGATRFEDYEFNSFIEGFGLKNDGLYALAGGAYLDGWVDFGEDNFNQLGQVRLPCAYFEVSSTSPIHVVVTDDSGNSYDYAARNADSSMKIQRVDFGLGLKSSRFNLLVKNGNGDDFSLASSNFTPVGTGRRI